MDSYSAAPATSSSSGIFEVALTPLNYILEEERGTTPKGAQGDSSQPPCLRVSYDFHSPTPEKYVGCHSTPMLEDALSYALASCCCQIERGCLLSSIAPPHAASTESQGSTIHRPSQAGVARTQDGRRFVFSFPVEGTYLLVVGIPQLLWELMGYAVVSWLSTVAITGHRVRLAAAHGSEGNPDADSPLAYDSLSSRLKKDSGRVVLEAVVAQLQRLHRAVHQELLVSFNNSQQQQSRTRERFMSATPLLRALTSLCFEIPSPLRYQAPTLSHAQHMVREALQPPSSCLHMGTTSAAADRYVWVSYALWFAGEPVVAEASSSTLHHVLRPVALSLLLEGQRSSSGIRGTQAEPMLRAYLTPSERHAQMQRNGRGVRGISHAPPPAATTDGAASSSSSGACGVVVFGASTPSGWVLVVEAERSVSPFTGLPLSIMTAQAQRLLRGVVDSRDFLQMLAQGSSAVILRQPSSAAAAGGGIAAHIPALASVARFAVYQFEYQGPSATAGQCTSPSRADGEIYTLFSLENSELTASSVKCGATRTQQWVRVLEVGTKAIAEDFASPFRGNRSSLDAVLHELQRREEEEESEERRKKKVKPSSSAAAPQKQLEWNAGDQHRAEQEKYLLAATAPPPQEEPEKHTDEGKRKKEKECETGAAATPAPSPSSSTQLLGHHGRISPRLWQSVVPLLELCKRGPCGTFSHLSVYHPSRRCPSTSAAAAKKKEDEEAIQVVFHGIRDASSGAEKRKRVIFTVLELRPSKELQMATSMTASEEKRVSKEPTSRELKALTLWLLSKAQ